MSPFCGLYANPATRAPLSASFRRPPEASARAQERDGNSTRSMGWRDDQSTCHAEAKKTPNAAIWPVSGGHEPGCPKDQGVCGQHRETWARHRGESSNCHAVTGNAQSSEKQCVASGTRRNPMPGQSSPTPELQPQVYVHDAVVVAGRHDALAEARAQVLSL